ncbi:MAG: chromophore lyase CpcT/CpeT [Cyanobacteria bacterium]|nr:chromophore lyase CpcT/CpeT [Cyanobacteriota bacterium]
MTSSLTRLVRMLSAGFSNQDQAFENPPLYAHILVSFRPLPHLDPGSLLLEQWYAFAPGQPYRIRVLRAENATDGSLRIHNHALHDERRFWGAVEDPERMAQIQTEDLRLLDGCTYVVQPKGEGFVGEVEPGCRCLVERKGATAYLVSSFEIDSTAMRTIDRGHDPATHDQLWGTLAGPFEFQRCNDFSPEIPLAWLESWTT